MPSRKPVRSFPWRRLRLIPLAVGALALLLGFATGLIRLGWPIPLAADAGLHGPLMICGFFGTLICLERAVGLGCSWVYAAPAVSALGTIALVAGAAAVAAAAFLTAGIVLTLASAQMAWRVRTLFAAVLAVAAACWLIGTMVWMSGRPTAEATGWWLSFLVLTIAGERLELSRLAQLSTRSQWAFAAATAPVLIGAARGELTAHPAPLLGIGFAFITAWLLTHDIARRTVRSSGQVRFSATCMLAGYAWLGVAGLVLLMPAQISFAYDAAVHVIAIGFVLSMVFGHAPIILPAITGWHVGYRSAAYGALALLHGMVLARLIGDLADLDGLRMASGPLTLLALAAYAAVLLSARR